MAKNYRINTKGKNKTISIYGSLKDNEKEVVMLLVAKGYTPIPAERKTKTNKKSKENKEKINDLENTEIIKWFINKTDENGKAIFEERKREKGFLSARSWFIKNYLEKAQKEIINNRVEEIKIWFNNKMDEEGKARFEQELKDNKFFVAYSWFKDSYPKARAEMKVNREMEIEANKK